MGGGDSSHNDRTSSTGSINGDLSQDDETKRMLETVEFQKPEPPADTVLVFNELQVPNRKLSTDSCRTFNGK